MRPMPAPGRRQGIHRQAAEIEMFAPRRSQSDRDEPGSNARLVGTAARSRREQQMTQTDIVDPPIGDPTTTVGSNSLPELAARIRAEHAATGEALKSSVEHSIAAGELLIEAKAKVPHGQWLPWLRDNCAISERTAQLYMRLAKNRTAIEGQIRNGVADLSLNEAAALLMLSSDVRKVLDFARDCENLPVEEVIERCIAQGIGVFHDPSYNPFAGRSEAEKLEWHLFTIFLSHDGVAGRRGDDPMDACNHVEWVLQRPFQNVAEWLGEEGDKWRASCGMRAMPDRVKADWAAFLDQHRDWTLPDAIKKLESLQNEFVQESASRKVRKRRRRS
jgi:Protein of unknown function (DUF3102)